MRRCPQTFDWCIYIHYTYSIYIYTFIYCYFRLLKCLIECKECKWNLEVLRNNQEEGDPHTHTHPLRYAEKEKRATPPPPPPPPISGKQRRWSMFPIVNSTLAAISASFRKLPGPGGKCCSVGRCKKKKKKTKKTKKKKRSLWFSANGWEARGVGEKEG